jgi:hypothetical protein
MCIPAAGASYSAGLRLVTASLAKVAISYMKRRPGGIICRCIEWENMDSGNRYV